MEAFKQLTETLGAGWKGFFDALDSPGGHVFLFAALYIGMSAFHASEQDRQGVLQALLLVLRPGGK